jgi:hypothetical protein
MLSEDKALRIKAAHVSLCSCSWLSAMSHCPWRYTIVVASLVILGVCLQEGKEEPVEDNVSLVSTRDRGGTTCQPFNRMGIFPVM